MTFTNRSSPDTDEKLSDHNTSPDAGNDTGGVAGGVGNTVQVLKPGYAVNSFFVFKHKVDANGKPVTGDKTDAELYEDTNGDGSVNFNDLAHILFDQALLAEGGLPDDPAAYVKRVNALLV